MKAKEVRAAINQLNRSAIGGSVFLMVPLRPWNTGQDRFNRHRIPRTEALRFLRGIGADEEIAAHVTASAVVLGETSPS